MVSRIERSSSQADAYSDVAPCQMTDATHIYHALLARHGEPNWWPARTPYEVIVGAVLTQNTAWANVEKAIANFCDDLTPRRIALMGADELMQLIRPAGFFVQKAATLKAVTSWLATYGDSVGTVQAQPLPRLRRELLAIKGVGPETADAILLYAFGFAVFVVDAYTMRLCQRYPLEAGNTYASAQAYFEAALPVDVAVYNRLHALIVINAKQHCRKRPKCDGCPLVDGCASVTPGAPATRASAS